MPTHSRLCIFGESPLVEEYASLCLNKGYEVSVRLNTLPTGSRQRSRRSGSRTGGSLLPKGARSVTRPLRTADIAIELTNTSMEAKKQNLVELDRGLPGRVPILTSSVAVTVTEQCRWISSPRRLIGIGALPTLIEGSLIEFACSGSTDEPTLSAAREFATTIGKESALAQDSVGLVTPRILCMLVNEAYFAMKEGVAAGRDIDLAMRLGTNYPYGPVEWADRIGVRQVHAIVSALYRSFGEDRYRVAPLLQVTADRAALANA